MREPWRSAEKWTAALRDPDDMTAAQRKIAEAAIDSFAENGFSGTATSEIARRAGVAEGTIFKHYRTKKELLIRLVAPVVVKVMGSATLRSVGDILDDTSTTFEQLLRALLRERLAFVRAHPKIVRVMLQEFPFHPEMHQLFHDEVFVQMKPLMTGAIARFKESGEIADDTPDATVMRLVLTTFLGYAAASSWMLPHLVWNDEQEIDIMVHMLTAGLAPR